MLINQIKTLSKSGEIEKIIYRIQYLASNDCNFINLLLPKTQVIDFFKSEGFKVDKLLFGITRISW